MPSEQPFDLINANRLQLVSERDSFTPARYRQMQSHFSNQAAACSLARRKTIPVASANFSSHHRTTMTYPVGSEIESMKILICAYACNPYLGSENRVGWATVRCLARDHELHVVTSSRNRADLVRAAAEGLVPSNVRFHHAGQFKEWHPNRLRARFQGWSEYVNFSRNILPVARELHRVEKFDLVHHVTFATWRVASPLWQLGIPLVFGPVGGGEQFPPRFFPVLSFPAVAFESLRMVSNLASRFSPAVRNCLGRAAHVFAANNETEQVVKAVRGSDHGVSRLQPGFYPAAAIRDFARFDTGKNPGGPLRLFAGGNMEGRKGVALALAALARVKRNGVDFRYRLAAGGPEIPHLKKLAARLGLQGEIHFGDNLQGEEYRRELGATHVFLLPSFRESSGLTMMEAMLAGCVPVVADCGGPGFIVTDECGYKIPVVNREQMVAQITETIAGMDRNRKMILEKGRTASHRIATDFSEENYLKTVNAVYTSVAKR
jgi:glycosyltransferase involved in cell wall biosynthesis